MSFNQTSPARLESELNELRINSMVKALGTQREQALNQTAKLIGDLAVEKARITMLESSLSTAAVRIDGVTKANAALVARILELETAPVVPKIEHSASMPVATETSFVRADAVSAGPSDFSAAIPEGTVPKTDKHEYGGF